MPIRSRVAEAEMRRESRAQAQRYGQTWIDDSNRDASLLLVRSRVFRAQSRVLISGPLMGSPSFLDFIGTFPKIDVPLTFLIFDLSFDTAEKHTTTRALEEFGSTPEVIPIDARSTDARLRAEHRLVTEFSQALAKLRDQGIARTNGVVIADQKVSIRDTLLVVDDSVWFLGGMFKATGSGISLMLMLPDAESIITRLEDLVERSLSIDAYRAELSIRLGQHTQEG